jgi:hypothetical protein
MILVWENLHKAKGNKKIRKQYNSITTIQHRLINRKKRMRVNRRIREKNRRKIKKRKLISRGKMRVS